MVGGGKLTVLRLASELLAAPQPGHCPLGVADVASRVHINTSGCLLRGNITKVQGIHEEFERTSKNFGKLTML